MTADDRALVATVSQTVGPYFKIGLAWLFDHDVAGPAAIGERLTIAGRVLDGDGQPVPDALLEIWQADASGTYSASAGAGQTAASFKGHARIPTGDDGTFRFETVKPGRVSAPDGGLQAPHILVTVFMRGLLRPLWTRIYFAGDPANAADLLLGLVPEGRRRTLLAEPRGGRADALEWNVVLQGPDETVFFEY